MPVLIKQLTLWLFKWPLNSSILWLASNVTLMTANVAQARSTRQRVSLKVLVPFVLPVLCRICRHVQL